MFITTTFNIEGYRIAAGCVHLSGGSQRHERRHAIYAQRLGTVIGCAQHDAPVAGKLHSRNDRRRTFAPAMTAVDQEATRLESADANP